MLRGAPGKPRGMSSVRWGLNSVCRLGCGSSEEGRGRSHSRYYLKQELCKAPELEGVYGPQQDDDLTALLQEERCSCSETVESEVVFIVKILRIGNLLPEFGRYLKVYLKPGKSALAWCLSAGKQNIRTICLPLLHSFLMPAAINEGQKDLVHARCTIQYLSTHKGGSTPSLLPGLRE